MKKMDDIVKFLESSIPRDEVATRDGGRGRKLSYLETWKVIDLLNEAFGNLGWDSETVELIQVAGTKFPTYRAKVKLTALVQVSEGNFLKVTKEGCGWGADKSDMNAHEMAVKEAESDALKRAAMKFGKRLGLALYDRTQEYVTDETETTNTEAKPVQAKVPTKSEDKKISRDEINKLIRSTAKVAIDCKKIAPDRAKGLILDYGVESVDALSDTQAKEVLAKFEGMVSA